VVLKVVTRAARCRIQPQSHGIRWWCDGTATLRSFRRALRLWLAVHFGDEARDRVGANSHADRGKQLADEPQRAPLLSQLYDAVPEGHQPGVTTR
jgi:hypothetical protein